MTKSIYLFFFTLISAFAFADDAPDYANNKYWAALPTVFDNADWTPNDTTLHDNQTSAKADVFFIHPTTAIVGYKSNAEIDNEKINQKTDETTIKYQASVFNGACKVYAPRYRQALLHNFFKRNSQAAQNAFDLAYQDVKKAFQYYLDHYNNGRPIVIASHSQGSLLAIRLLQDFFDGTTLQKQLVQAYVIGYPVQENQFHFLKVCQSPDDLGTIVSYNTFEMDANPNNFVHEYNNAICVNPLSWTTEKTFVTSKYNLGSLQNNSGNIIPNMTGAKCGNGILEIQKPKEKGFIPLLKSNYHIYDYSLFYINIRENITHRVNLFTTTKTNN
ncbi:MAG: DUF3089 domain-containing protein [Chitinophagales bacterium]|nr:DUF3089 domain-containing protein [Chitinophagales bacterium]